MWRTVHDYPAYEVSDAGEVRRGGTLLKQYTTKKGYKTITLSSGTRRQNRQVHVMVLEAFDRLRAAGEQTRHLDGDPSNNSTSNLQWGTPSENNRDRVTHGTHHETAKTRCPYGHLLVAPNLIAKRASRACLSCSRERALARAQGRAFDPAKADERYKTMVVE